MGRAQWKLGLLYRDGEGVPQDGAKAALWLRRAAEKDFPSAEYDLGKMYDLGLGVPKDYVQAEQWYYRAAEHGYSLRNSTWASFMLMAVRAYPKTLRRPITGWLLQLQKRRRTL